MLSNPYFYWSLTRKYVVLFGSLFNNIIIERTNSANNALTQMINIPVSYSSKDKSLTRVLEDPKIDRPEAIILPAISFEMLDFQYDSDRKLQTSGRQFANMSNTTIQTNYNPVPYNIIFGLYIYTKNNEDGLKILEQILPFFTPNFTIKAFLIENLPSFDIPIILNSVKLSDENDKDFKDRRIQIWNLIFTLKGYYWGPVINKPIINIANISFYTGTLPVQNTFIWNYGLDDIANSNDLIFPSGNGTSNAPVNEYLTVNSSSNTYTVVAVNE